MNEVIYFDNVWDTPIGTHNSHNYLVHLNIIYQSKSKCASIVATHCLKHIEAILCGRNVACSNQ